jgi:glycolate oxidase
MNSMNYNKLTPELIKRLAEITGEKNILTDAGKEDYSHDEAPHSHPIPPEAVVKPESPEAVAAILKLASENKIPVTPRGAGTGLAGGAVPNLGGISLSLEKLNKIIEIDEDNFCATVEAGVILTAFCQAVEARGLYYPLYPGEMSASLGGNVATNAGGMRAVKYGVTRNFVLGTEAVLPTGEIIRTGGKYVKSSAGYDLTQLLVGSEGTLAVITKATLKLITPPGSREILFIPFNRLTDAIRCVPAILKEKILPVGIEFMEQDIIRMVEGYTGLKIPMSGYPAYLMLFVECGSQEEFMNIAERIGAICMERGAVDVFLPNTDQFKHTLMEAREKFYPTLQHNGLLDLADVVVPRSRIAEFVEKVKEISAKHSIQVVAYGHAGDGNVHIHPIGSSVEAARLKELLAEIYAAGIALGGTISGEHGLGLDKKGYFSLEAGKAKLDLMKRIKLAFDPHNILNPGKVLD